MPTAKDNLQKEQDAKYFWEAIESTRKFQRKATSSFKYLFQNCTSKIYYLYQILFSINLYSRILEFFNFFIPDFTPDKSVIDSDSDFDEIFGTQRGGDKFLDAYTVEDITNLIKKSKMNDRLIKLGFGDWYVSFDLSDSYSHYGYIRTPQLQDPNQYIGFLIVQNGAYRLSFRNDNPWSDFVLHTFPKNANILNIRWFSLQNPLGSFSPTRPKLPGQIYPGSGLARDALALFCQLGLKHRRDGISNVPEHFHNAYHYTGFIFLNPLDEGRFEKMKEDLDEDIKFRGIAAVSWAIYLGFLRENEKHIKWVPHEQVLPLSVRMAFYFHSAEYQMMVELAKSGTGHFYIEWEEAEKYCMSSILNSSQFVGKKDDKNTNK